MIEHTNVLVTGGAGFIGMNLVNKLVAQGNTVYVIDNFSGGLRTNVNSSAILVPGDVREYSSFRILENAEIAYVFHFAAPSSVILFNKNPVECTDITVQGFLNAHDFAEKVGAEFIYPSSGSLYSGCETPNSEMTSLKIECMNAYAKAKYVLEKRNEIGTGLRIFAGYGPTEAHKGDIASVVYYFVHSIFHDVRPIVYGDGTQTRDFVYIDDIVNAILAIAENSGEKIVNIGSGEKRSFNDIIVLTNKILGKDIKPEYVDKPTNYLEETLCDTSLMNKYYSEKQTDISKGITQIVDSLT